MAYLTTFEGEDTATAAPLTIQDLFNVNDYYGVKLFGNAWNDVKRAAAIIAQRAVNAPILFYIRAQGNAKAAPGTSSEMGRKLWGYNDRAGVELLGAPTWGAVKNEFDELLGWSFNPFSAVKKVFDTARIPFDWAANKIESWDIPVISDTATVYKKVVGIGDEVSPFTPAEKAYNKVVLNKEYATDKQIEAKREAEKQAQLQQMLLDQSARASKAASEAAKAQKAYEERTAEIEKVLQNYGASLQPVVQEYAKVEQEKSAKLNTFIWVGGGLAAIYLLTRNKKG